MELSILNAIQTLHSKPLDTVMLFFTHLGDNGLIWILLTAILLLIPKTRKVGAFVLLALAMELLICNLGIKPFVRRIRPCDVNTAIELLVKHPKDYSFPSGHTGAGFACVGALLFFGSRLWKPALCLAILIAFSRLYLYVHYPTDVLGGALLGLASAWIAVKLFKKNKL